MIELEGRTTVGPWRIAVYTAVGVGMAGAVYLYVVRGPAMLLDFASGVAGVFCL